MNKEQKFTKEWIYFIPIIIFSAIIPLIVHLKVVNLDIHTSSLLGEEVKTDFYSYYKMILILLTSSLSIISLVIMKVKNRLTVKINAIIIILMAYGFFITISMISSDYKNIALLGFNNSYEGGLVLLSYLLITIITFSFIKNEKHIKWILGGIVLSASIIGIIGTMQYFGYDIFNQEIIKELIVPNSLSHQIDKIDIRFGKYTIYSTLENSNYVGSYTAMLFPISIGLFIYSKSKKGNIVLGLFSCLMFINLIGSRSKAALLGSLVSLVLITYLFRVQIKDNIYKILGLIGGFAILLAFMIMAPEGNIQEKLSTLIKSDYGNVEKEKLIEDIEVKGNEARIFAKVSDLTIKLQGETIVFEGENQKELKLSNADKGQGYTFEEGNYKKFKINFKTEDNLLSINIGDSIIRLLLDYNEGIKLINYKGKIADIPEVEKVNTFFDDKFASSRGYIWARTIPMLKETIFIGYGADTYPFYFPQEDIVGKYKVYGTDAMLIDKPHNIYIQIATENGIIALVLIILAFVLYFISSFKKSTEIPNTNNFSDIIRVSILSGLTGYLITGIFNDSVVSVAPVFWTLFGIGIALTYKERIS